MAYASAEGGGGYGVDASIIHFDPAHADHVRVPDAELLFRGEYQRLGPDLVVTGPDGRHHIIPGYFSSEKHPALVAPNGASLTPDVVDLLAGSPTPGQYAQAQPTTPPDSIGKVEKVIGSVTVVRNGVAVALHVGDAVYKSDVVQTGANSSVGIGFPDGTALNLVANTRMALNDYSFDASGTSNSALFTLVEGTFAFVAGKVAHDGNMKVATPVATMGIRGTTVYFASVTSSLGEVQYLAQLFADYQTGHVGAVEWFDNNPASPTYGQLIDTITDTGYAHYFTPRLGQSPLVNVQPATASQLQNDIISALSHLIDLINNGNQSTTPNSGSSTLPDIDVPRVFQPNGGNNPGPFTFNFVVPGLTAPIFITVVPLQTTTQILTSLPSSNETQSNPLPPPPGTIVWTSSESGPWSTGGNWNSGNVPGQINNVEIDQRVAGKPLTVTVADSEAANNLVIGRGVILHIDSGGFLFVANGLDDFGVVQVGSGDPPKLTVNGPVTVESGAQIEALGEGTQIQLSNVTLSNLGTIEAANLATITIDLKGDSTNAGVIEGFNGGVITLNGNGHGFTNQILIEAFGEGTQIQLSDITLSNLGTIEAEALATITIDLNGDSTNAGVIEGFNGGVITLNENGHGFTNQFLIEALDGGGVSIVGDVTNLAGASIEAIGPNAFIDVSNGTIDNQGGARIEASDRGSITFDSETVTNDSGAEIEAKHLGAITFDGGPVTNDSGAKIEAKHYGTIAFSGDGVTNNSGAEIEAKDHGAIAFTGVGLSNEADATIEAKDYGTVTFTQTEDGPGGIENAGTMEAKNHGTVTFQDIGGDNNGGITNTDGTVAAVGLGAVVNFEHSSIIGGTLNADGGAIFVDANSTLTGSVNVGIGGGGFADFADVINANDGAAVSVAFTGMGTLELDQQPAAPITVTGFGIGDALDLTNIAFNGCMTVIATWADNTLTLDNGQQTESFTLAGSGNITLEPDAFGGTEVFFGNDVWTNTAGGNWNHESNWSDGVPEGCSTDAVIGVSGVYTVTISQSDETDRANSLAITDRGATLTGSGMLSIATTLDNAGIIDATGCNVLNVEANTLINEYSGVIAALDGGNLTITEDAGGINYGMMKAANGGTLTINHDGTATNELGATIEAVTHGNIILNNNLADVNDGLMKAADGGSIIINVDNFDPSDQSSNFGRMEAVDGGAFSIFGNMFNAAGATIKAVGDGSQFDFSNADYDGAPTLVGNAGTIVAKDHGAISFSEVGVDNQTGGIILAKDFGTVTFDVGGITNEAGATIAAEDYGTITFEDINANGGLTNLGTVEALGWGSKVAIDNSTVTGGTLTADGGTLFVGGDSTLSNVAIVINHGGIAEFGDALTNTTVTFGAVGLPGDGTLELDQAPGAGAVVTNFAANGANDVLDFTIDNIAWSNGPTASWVENEQQTAGILTITYQTVDGNMTQSYSESITLNGNYAPNAFTVLSDPTGGTDVVYGVQQIWTGGTSDQWNTASNWRNGVVPGATDTAIIDNVNQPVIVSDTEQVANLRIDPGATLDLVNGGDLGVSNVLDDAGVINIDATGSDPRLVADDPVQVRVEGGAEINIDGSGASAGFSDDQVGNAGTITALNNGTMSFEGAAVHNQDGGVIEATNNGTVSFDDATVTNEDGGTIRATEGGTVQFDPTTVTNQGQIEADGGTVSFDGSRVDNHGGTIQADAESVVKLAGSTIDGGEIGGEGTLEVAGSSILKGSAEVAIGQINVEDGVTLTADHISIDGSTINLGHVATGNAASFTEISVPDVNAIGPAISADGEFVAFIASTNLPGQDHGDVENVAVELYDAATGKLTDISAAAPALPAGDISLGFSNVPSISADGRYVVFDEKYEVPNNQGPAMETTEVLLYDRQSQTATVVQTFAGHAEISGDGQYIAMQSDTIPGDNASFGESVLVTDRAGNPLTTISGDPTYQPPEGPSPFGNVGSVYDPDISSDGRFVTFWTTASQIEINDNLVQTGNSHPDNAEVYIYDRLNDKLQMVSAAGGTPGDGDSGTTTLGNNQDSSWPSSMSADGRYVVFQSSADNLFANVGDAAHDVSNIFLYDTQTGTITAITDANSPSAVGSIRPEISADGTLVTFASDESDLPGANGIAQTYVYDTQTQTTSIVSATDGNSANAESDLASAVSANGSAIAFGSLADNLVIPTANDGNANIYLAAPGTIAVTGDTYINNTTINDGTVIVDNCVTLTLSDVALNGTFVQVVAGANLDLLGAIRGGGVLDNLGIVAAVLGSTASIDVHTVTNELTGMVEALDGGNLTITEDYGTNYGTAEAAGNGSVLTINELKPGSANYGTIEAVNGANLTINHELTEIGNVTIAANGTNESGGLIKADGGTLIDNDLQGDANYGTVEATNGGAVTLNVTAVPGFAGGGGNFGVFEATLGGTLFINNGFDNHSGATIKADGAGSEVDFADGNFVGKNAGTIEAENQGVMSIDSFNINNEGGTIAAYGLGSVVELANAGIGGGTLATGDPAANDLGIIEIITPVVGTNTTFFNGFVHGTLTVDAFVQVDAGANLELIGTIDNEGTIFVDSQESAGASLLIFDTVTLDGSGAVTLETGSDAIIAVASGAELDNYSSISGAGAIGTGDGNLTLQNEIGGTIDANVSGQRLVIDTGSNAISNNGAWEANAGTLLVRSDVTGAGSAVITGGGTADFQGAFDQNVTFTGAGTLELAQSQSYDHTITGFGAGDALDLNDFAYNTEHPGCMTVTWTQGSGTLTIGNGTQTPETIHLTGTYTQSEFSLTQDSGTGTEVVFTPVNLVVNGGFETGDLTGWTQSGNLGFTSVGTDFLGVSPHSGNYVLHLGPVGSDGYLDQNIPTVGGQTYQIEFWLANPSGGTSDFSANFGGTTLVSLVDTAPQGYTEYVYDVTAPSSLTDLQFAARQDPDYWYLDDISVTPVVTGTDPTIDAGATLVFGGAVAAGVTVSFTGSTGTLIIGQPPDFHAEIAGISGSGQVLDLTGYDTSTTATTGANSYDPVTKTTTLTVTDPGHQTLEFQLAGDLSGSHWTVTADNSNTGVDIVDPPTTTVVSSATVSDVSGTITFPDADIANMQTATITPENSDYLGTFWLDPLIKSNGTASIGFEFDLGKDQINLPSGQTLTQSYGVSVTDAQNPALNVNQTVSVSIGGPGNDNFVFKPGIGADTIVNFDPQHDTIELDHFTNIQSMQQLESLITADAHGDAVIALGHHDSITVAGVTGAQLHQLAQTGHVIMH